MIVDPAPDSQARRDKGALIAHGERKNCRRVAAFAGLMNNVVCSQQSQKATYGTHQGLPIILLDYLA